MWDRAESPGPIFTDGISSHPWSELVGETYVFLPMANPVLTTG